MDSGNEEGSEAAQNKTTTDKEESQDYWLLYSRLYASFVRGAWLFNSEDNGYEGTRE